MQKSNTTKRQLYSRHECHTWLGPSSWAPAATAGQAGRHRAPTLSAPLRSNAQVEGGHRTRHGALHVLPPPYHLHYAWPPALE